MVTGIDIAHPGFLIWVTLSGLYFVSYDLL